MNDFFTKYAARISVGTPDDCWLWLGAKASAGYGHGHRNNVHFYAHRAAYESEHGQGSAVGWVVRHTCDNPPCCNPGHLLIGTHADNMADMDARGRRNAVSGERVNTARLSPEQVIEARRLAADGVPICHLVKMFSINQGAMTAAVTGRTWSHLPDAVAVPTRSDHPEKLPQGIAQEIRRRSLAGERGVDLAAEFGVSKGTVSAIKTGRSHVHV